MEEFFKCYQYTFSALGTIATFLAVVISLYFGYRALKSSETKIDAYLNSSSIIQGGENLGDYITITIRNKGLFPVRIPFAFFNIVSCLVTKEVRRVVVNPWDFWDHDVNLPQKVYPYTIEPKHTETFFIDKKDNFISKTIPAVISKHKKNPKFSLVARLPYSLCAKFVTIKVLTDDGKYFKAGLSKQLIKDIKEQCNNKKESK